MGASKFAYYKNHFELGFQLLVAKCMLADEKFKNKCMALKSLQTLDKELILFL